MAPQCPAAGLNIGLLRNYGGTYALAAIARMLQSQTNTNIVSTPNLITLDNEEAKIIVGSNVPFITGQFTNTGVGHHQPVPDHRAQGRRHHAAHPAAGRRRRRGAHDDLPGVSRASATKVAPGTSNAGPSTDKRSIESTVVVDDGAILVLGGLIEDKFSQNMSKVPLLGDIPYLGALFRSESRTRTRTNLMVFLRPVVMRDIDSATKLSLDRYDLIRARQQEAQPVPSAILGSSSPVVPPPSLGAPMAPVHTATPPAIPPPAPRRHPPTDPALAQPWLRDTRCPTRFAKANTLLLEDDGAQRRAVGRRQLQRQRACPRWCGCSTSPASSAKPPARWPSASPWPTPGGESSAAAVVGEVESAVDLSRLMQELPAVEDLLEAADDAPIIRMLNALLTQAAKDGASDIHIEPYERSSSVRFRVDGTLREVVRPNKALHAALISRLKIMAELDIAEKRLPQDGRISLRIGGRAVDVRVSTLPAAHGERAVLRLLDKTDANFSLEGLGMSAGAAWSDSSDMIEQPHGIVLVTGPTGSGKTTTLYASLARLPTSTTNILTVEDPVEYELPGIGQTQVNPKIDLTFAKALRAIPAPGSRRHHDRRDPRRGNGADRDPGLAHRPPGAGHRCTPTTHRRAVTRLIDMGSSRTC